MSSFRTTITVPRDLKERMDAVAVEVNWSAVAARAFEEKLIEITTSKEKREMSHFIRVLGPDPENKRRQAHQHVDSRIICKTIPVYAVEKDGKLFDCTPSFKGAKIVSYRLIDTNGVNYSCGNRLELERVGLIQESVKGRIGFVQVGGKKLEWDMADESDVT